MSLPWMKTSLVKESSDWDFHSTVASGLDSLYQQGQALMQPVTEQVRSVVQQAMPATPAPMQMPEPRVPDVPTFSLGTLEDWGMGMPRAPQRPREPSAEPSDPRPSPNQPGSVTPSSGLFSLGSAADWLSPITSPSGPEPPAGRGAALPEGAAPRPAGPSDVNEYLKVAALKAGVDPSQVLAVMGKEGPTGWGSVGTFDTGTSYGPLQLHYAGGSNPKEGMGDRFTKATGIDLRKDSSLQAHQAAVDFAMQELVKRGDWSEWYGAEPALGSRFTTVARVTPSTVAQGAASQAGSPTPSGGLDVGGITAEYKGQPYVFGGQGGRSTFAPGTPTDCSGFVASVWKNQYGLDLAAHTDTSYTQLQKLGAQEVSGADARSGDIVYYLGAGTGGAIAHHMGIYAGPGKVLDMSTSGQSGVSVRDIGHGGQYVILRDPRVNGSAQASAAAAPPPIVPTGVAERTGGERVTAQQVEALSEEPNPTTQPWNLPFGGGTAAAAPPARDDWRTAPAASAAPAAAPRLHGKVLAAFRAANGTDPDPSEVAELAALGYGIG